MFETKFDWGCPATPQVFLVSADTNTLILSIEHHPGLEGHYH